MVKSCQPESKSQSRELMALIWKGLGSLVVVRLSRIWALTSPAGVSDSAPSLSTGQLAIAPMALSAVVRLLYSVGERVEAEAVVYAVGGVDELVDFEAVGGEGGAFQAVGQGEIQRHALLQGVLQLLGQLGFEAGADGELSVALDFGFKAGGGDGFGAGGGGGEQGGSKHEHAKAA